MPANAAVRPGFLLRTTIVLPIVAGFLISLAAPARGYPPNQTGRWTPTHALNGIEVHMALLPGGDGSPYSAKVLWWFGLNHDEQTYAGLLKWKAGDYDCSSYPTSLIKDTTVVLPPDTAGVFCSSESHLDGKLFLAGGTQPGTEYGVSHAFVFDPGTEQWTRVDSMGVGIKRWYPTSCALPASGPAGQKQLVLSGSRYHQIEFFGGLESGNAVPTDSAVFRYGMGGKGVNDGAVRQSMTPALWPQPREGHTVARFGQTHLFGGKNRKGDYLGDYWQLTRPDSALRSDYDYQWQKYEVQGMTPPPARWEHTAIATTGDPYTRMIIFGGIGKNLEDSTDFVRNDVWRLYWNTAIGHDRMEWQQLDITGSAPARSGHVAAYDATRKRMLVFGGRDTPTGTPSDSTLWSLQFNTDFQSGSWTQLTDVTGPSPRFDHAISFDPGAPDTLFLFGGNLGGGSKKNDVWRLNLAATPSWEAITDLEGDAPSPRSGHTVTLLGHLLIVFGGVPNDSTVYVAHLHAHNEGEQMGWTTFTAHEAALSGHTAIFYGQTAERVPQIFDPNAGSGNQWTSLTGAPRLLDWYPQTFVWKPDTVFVSGPDSLSYKLALAPTPAWVKYPQGNSGFRGGSAVMYRPGKVMKCGSRDTDGGGNAVGTTRSIDLSLQSSGEWKNSLNDMAPRVNHNLVVLPNGRVLVVGGTGGINNQDTLSPVRRPEIWDPELTDGQGNRGRWLGLDTLAQHQINRDYHSTALLLPDGRVLTGGGNTDNNNYNKIEIFCPPYLFNASGALATRPGLVEPPPRVVRYGAQYSLCRTSSDAISMVSLIRPAAVTHGFDENQRFVPLTISTSSGPPPQLTVTFPSDSAAAPPGEYLLFVVNDSGVPSIARWVRLMSSSDVTTPAAVGDLTRDMVATNAVNLTWTAPGDDSLTGTATRVDLRYSLSPINANNFCQASIPDSLPPPGAGGSAQHYAVTGLAPCKTYYFALKYWDEVNNVSVFGDTAVATTLCGDCCSGEARAHLADGEATSAGGRRAESPTATVASGTTNAAAPASAARGLVVEATPGPFGLDLKTFPITDTYEGHAVASDGGVLLQRPDGAGRWTDWLDYDLPAGNQLALCVPERSSRWVFLTPCAVAGLLPAPGGEGAAWRLDSARHSRLGDVTAALADSLPRLGDGDTLFAHYAAAPDTGTLSRSWLLLLDRTLAEAAPNRAGRRGSPEGAGLPVAFALLQNQPNPFAERATIHFALPMASRVRLEVFDLLGRRLRTLTDRGYEAGEHEVIWDRRTTRGALAAPGLYFYRMEAGEFRARRAMMIVP